jgi:glutamine amidotransferase
MILIVDYNVGNVASIANMLRKVGAEARVAGTAADILAAEKLILPGVGSFDNGMIQLRSRQLIDPLNEMVVNRNTPILGICLGLQLFGRRSAEGREEGLGWLDAESVRFQFSSESRNLKVPHMGWNTVQVPEMQTSRTLVPENARFYFVHGYHLACRSDSDVAGRTHYGYDFVSAVQRGNISGVQFHPEKSHRFGMELLRRFAERDG